VRRHRARRSTFSFAFADSDRIYAGGWTTASHANTLVVAALLGIQ